MTSEHEIDRLPSGRHHLTREEVAASQRARLLGGVVQAVADKGYPATTVADVVTRAGVSRKTFYEHFDAKEDCFLEAFDAGLEVLFARLTAAAAGIPAADWRERISSDLGTWLTVLAEEPEWAWSLHVELLSAGPAALERRAQVFAQFSERIRRINAAARKAEPGLPKLPPEAFVLHAGGMDELVRDCLRTHGAAALPKLTAPAVAVTVALFGAR